jgi:hypothetical protein
MCVRILELLNQAPDLDSGPGHFVAASGALVASIVIDAVVCRLRWTAPFRNPNTPSIASNVGSVRTKPLLVTASRTAAFHACSAADEWLPPDTTPQVTGPADAQLSKA